MTQSTEKIYEYFQTLRNSMDIEVRTQAIQELLEIDETVFANFLNKTLKIETDTEILAYIAEIVVKKNLEQRASLILPLIQSPDPLLRRHVCGLLGNCGDKIAVEDLIDRLRKDEDTNVRVVAAQALGRIGGTRALTDLIWSRDHDFSIDKDGWSVSAIATRAIEKIEERNRKA